MSADIIVNREELQIFINRQGKIVVDYPVDIRFRNRVYPESPAIIAVNEVPGVIKCNRYIGVISIVNEKSVIRRVTLEYQPLDRILMCDLHAHIRPPVGDYVGPGMCKPIRAKITYAFKDFEIIIAIIFNYTVAWIV